MKKRLLSLFLVGMMLFMLVPMSASADEKTVITEIVATYEFVQPAYGQKITKDGFTFTVEGGIPVTISSQNFDWYKSTDGEWHDVDYGYFSDGTWCHDIRIILEDYENYEFSDEGVDVIINGVKWDTVFGDEWIKSPAFEIEFVEGLSLAFYSHTSYYVGDSYIGKAIAEHSFAPGVIGGARPYTFSKSSGPDWLQVSADGVLTGTPAVKGENDDLVVTVTDANGATSSLAVDVGNTYMNPADREVVSRVVGTVELPSFKCGDRLDIYSTPVVIEGWPAVLSVASTDFYLIDSEDNIGETVYTATYGETYIYDIWVAIEDDAGHTHVLDENLEVVINGITTTCTPGIGDDFSYSWVKVMEKVTAEHWFDNATDATCNGCDFVREGCDHQYELDCSEKCTVCGALRTAEHDYDNICDAECNVCGKTREVPDHVYENCYDAYCGECDFCRMTPAHTYNSCTDTVCTTCGAERIPEHIYDDFLDTDCNSCGTTRVLNTIKLNEEKVAEITVDGKSVDYIFTPSVSGTFVFGSYCEDESTDTKAYILTVDGEQLMYNDDGGNARQFRMEYEFEAGETYVLRVMFYSDTKTGSIPFSVEGLCLGDVSGDGTITATDYMFARRYVMNTYSLTEEQIKAADVDGDGEVTSVDYMFIRRHVMGTYVIGG